MYFMCLMLGIRLSTMYNKEALESVIIVTGRSLVGSILVSSRSTASKNPFTMLCVLLAYSNRRRSLNMVRYRRGRPLPR